MDVPAIGIDLGTTNTCVAVLKNFRVDVIENDQGTRTFPSMVCFTDEGPEIGHVAKDKEHEYPETTVYDVKRIIGNKFKDISTQKQMKQWPFQVIDNGGDNPAIRVKENGSATDYYPEEISALVLKHAKKLAENHLGCQVTRAVITVPAYFNNSQRQATKDAAKIAGLKVLSIINEPTAAAIAYGWENKSFVERTVLIYDLGGGTFDVSIVHIDGNNYTVKATSGETHLGGGDFDANLVELLATKFQTKYNMDLRGDKYAMRRLMSQCENVKKKLSFNLKANVELYSIYESKNLILDVTRIQFELVNNEIFQKTIGIVGTCLADSGLSKKGITDIVLVGGSTRIPKIQELLKMYFGGRDLMKSINPDESVAIGAAIQASMLNGEKSEIPIKINFKDVTPFSLGNNIVGGEFAVVIKRNTTIPCKISREFFTASDYQTTAVSKIYQGERKLAEENHFLGKYTITNLPKRPRGEVKFIDTYSLDENGILHVNSVVEGTDLKSDISVQLEENRLSQEEIQRLIREAEQRSTQDQNNIGLQKAHYELESYCQSAKAMAQIDRNRLGEETTLKIIRTCDDGLSRMKLVKDTAQMKRLLQETKNICQPLLN